MAPFLHPCLSSIIGERFLEVKAVPDAVIIPIWDDPDIFQVED